MDTAAFSTNPMAGVLHTDERRQSEWCYDLECHSEGALQHQESPIQYVADCVQYIDLGCLQSPAAHALPFIVFGDIKATFTWPKQQHTEVSLQ